MQQEALNCLEKLIESAIKEPESHRLGSEFELLTLNSNYEPKQLTDKTGMNSLLQDIVNETDWTEGEEIKGSLYSLNHEIGTLTLEPGNQVELSARPCQSIFDLQEDFNLFLNTLKTRSKQFDIRFFGAALNPLIDPIKIPLSPKPRYQIMNEVFSKTGTMGHMMMRASTSIQICVDYKSLEDFKDQLDLSLRLSPFVSALFASSPFFGGEKSDDLSFRARVWQNTDPSRSGIPWQWLDKNTSLEQILQSLLDMPALFFREDNQYKAAFGKNFRECYTSDFESQKELCEAVNLHISQCFYETRFKKYLEFRTPDGQMPRFQFCVPAFYKGIFMDPGARKAARELLSEYSLSELQNIHQHVPKTAMKTELRSFEVLSVCKELLEIAAQGLNQIAKDSGFVRSEEVYLHPLMEIVYENSYCPAEYILRAYERDFGGDILKTLEFMSF